RHSARLNHEQQTPAVNKADQRMHGLAQINVLAAGLRDLRRKLGIDERPRQCNQSADGPCSENQKWSMNLLSYYIRIREDARADDPAHHDHRRVEEAETASKMRFARRFCRAPPRARGRGRGGVGYRCNLSPQPPLRVRRGGTRTFISVSLSGHSFK